MIRAHIAAISCAAIVAGLLSAACVSFGSIDDVVPPTVDEDDAQPRARIHVAGRDRWIHLRTFGDPSSPPLLVLHGSLGDARALLPLAALDDRYHVVFWDQRGNGLSERITEAEYTEASIIEEIDAVGRLVAGDVPLSLVGHSFGGMYAALYTSRQPKRVRELALLEPGGLRDDIFESTFDDVITIDLLDPELNALFWSSEQVGAINHEAADYRALMVLSNGDQTRYHCDPAHPPTWPVWRPGAAVDAWRAQILGGTSTGTGFQFDFARGLKSWPHEVLLVGGTCSALGPDYQRRHHLPLFRNARVEAIGNVGHRLVREAPEAVLNALRGYLEEYRSAP